MTTRRLALIFAVLAACNSGGGGDDSPPPPDGPAGDINVTFAWTIAHNGVPTTCADAGASEVKIEAIAENGLPVFRTFQCILLPGMVVLAPGRYAVSAKLYDGTNQQTRASVAAQSLTVPVVGTAPAMTFNFAL